MASVVIAKTGIRRDPPSHLTIVLGLSWVAITVLATAIRTGDVTWSW